MAKPTTLPRWADVGGAIINPTSGKKDVGFVDEEKPPAEFLNWLFNENYNWASYLNDGYFEGQFGLASAITPSAATGTLNDYNPTGWSTAQIIRLDLSGNTTLNGLAGGVDGRIAIIFNLTSVSARYLAIAHEAGASTAANRITVPGGVTRRLQGQGSCVILKYDGTTSRWRVINIYTTANDYMGLVQNTVLGPFGGTPSDPDAWSADVGAGYLETTGAGSAILRGYSVELPDGAVLEEIHATVRGHASEQLRMDFITYEVGVGRTGVAEPGDITSLAASDQALDITGLSQTISTGRSHFIQFLGTGVVANFRIYDLYIRWHRYSNP